MGNIFVIIAFVAYALVILGLLYRRAAARKLDNGYFSPGFGYERLAADGSARRDLRQRAD